MSRRLLVALGVGIALTAVGAPALAAGPALDVAARLSRLPLPPDATPPDARLALPADPTAALLTRPAPDWPCRRPTGDLTARPTTHLHA